MTVEELNVRVCSQCLQYVVLVLLGHVEYYPSTTKLPLIPARYQRVPAPMLVQYAAYEFYLHT